MRVNNTSACCLEPVQTGFLESALSLRLNPGKGHVEPSDVMGSKPDSAVFFSLPFFFSSLNQDMCVLQVQGAGRVMGQALPHSVHFVGSQGVKCDLPPPPAEVSRQ